MTSLSDEQAEAYITKLLTAVMSGSQRAEFEKKLECNFAISLPGGRAFA